MKRNWIQGICLCLLLVLTGCTSHNHSEQEIKQEPSISVETPQESEQETSEIPAPPEQTNFLDTAVPVGEDGVLYYIPNTWIEEREMQEIELFQNQLLSVYSEYHAEEKAYRLYLRLLNLDSGELCCENEIQLAGFSDAVVQVCGAQIAVSDSQSGTIYILDETLQETARYTVSGELIYVNSDATEAYGLTSTDGIHIFNLKSGEERVILEHTSDLSLYSKSEQNLSVRYIDLCTADKKECYAGLNLETGELEPFEIDDSFSGMEYHTGIWASELRADCNWYFLGTQQEAYRFQLEQTCSSMNLVGDPVHLILTELDADGKQRMMAYETDGTFLSACSFQDINGTVTLKQIWLQDPEGYLFLVIDDTGHERLYFWDLSQKVEGTDLQLVSYDEKIPIGGTVLDPAYYDRAAALSEQYGAAIKIADQCLTDYGDKTAEPEYDPDQIAAGLTVLEQTLSSYPDGFFRQLYYGAYRTMEINLMGEISNKETIEGHTPIAFVQHENGKIIMVLNIHASTDALKQNFYHESSHIIDQVLEHDALYREDALYSEETWCSMNPAEFFALNPAGNGYYESYAIMPMDYYQELFVPYFASDYGKSFSTEDRATIFENAMIGNRVIFSADVSAPLRAKLEYYCRCIRDCFDTTGWPDCTTWEAALNEI